MTTDIDLSNINCTARDGRMTLTGNTQHLIFFENGYGASIIRGEYTYGGRDGLWEIAVLAGASNDWKITYETPITDDVLGHLASEDVYAVLETIAALEPALGENDDE